MIMDCEDCKMHRERIEELEGSVQELAEQLDNATALLKEISKMAS